MKPVVIVGGGLAGLSAAVALCAKRIPVLLLEQKSVLGGRAYSFAEPRTGDIVDNGQHLLIAGYDRTMAFLSTVGSAGLVDIQNNPTLLFHHPEKGFRRFVVPPLPPPVNLIVAVLCCSLFSVGDRVRLLRAGWVLWQDDPGLLADQTVREWLDRFGQSDELRRSFWDPLSVAMMNETPERASAVVFVGAMKKAFLSSARAASLVFPRVGLSALFCDPARNYIESHGGIVRCSEEVKRLDVENNSVTGVELRSGKTIRTGACILAVPPNRASKIFSSSGHDGASGKESSSPIVSIHLWFEKEFMGDPFIGVIGRRVQWVFNRRRLAQSDNKGSYLCAVVSAAHELVGLKNGEIVQIAMDDLRSVYGNSVSRPVRHLVMREKKATISLTPGMSSSRPGSKTAIQNLFLAGDWTDTGYPATIEGAIVSGETASTDVLSFVENGGAGKP